MSTISELETKDDWDQAVGGQTCTKDQIEQAVIFVRRQLYNRDIPCGPKAVRKDLKPFNLSNLCRRKQPLLVFCHAMD